MPKEFELEAVARDLHGGLWILSSKQTLWMARGGAPRPVADVGSGAGALAVASDGSLYLGDGPKLWKLELPRDTAPAALPKRDATKPELVADGLGDIYGVAIASDGALLVTDWEGGRLLSIAPKSEPRLVAKGFEFPSGVVALPDGAALVKESGRQRNELPRLLRVERDGTMKEWVTLRREETR